MKGRWPLLGGRQKRNRLQADPEVDEALFPPQLDGDIWRDNFDLVVRDVKRIIFEADERRKREAARRRGWYQK
jgi:hypothetical protein